jgi:cell wall-associated NlpC family hydrolase
MRTTPNQRRLWLATAGLLTGWSLLAGGCATVSQAPPDAGAAARVVQLASSLKGSPYRYGGTTPAGFDCSGFVQYVFRQAAGISLPRTSQKQYAVARRVPRGGEEPSDLLFFDVDGRGISHVGIYLGQGRFVHAPSTGGEVKISNGNDAYWRSRFRGVGRVLK